MKRLFLLIFIISSTWAIEVADSSYFKEPAEVLRLGEKFTYQASVIGYEATANIYLWIDSLYHTVPVSEDTCYRFRFYTWLDPSTPFLKIRESILESYARKSDLVTLRFEKHLIEKEKEQHMIINFDLEENSAYYEQDIITYNNGSIVDSSGIKKTNYLGIHDFINIFFYLRLLKRFEINDTFYIWSFAEDRRFAYRLPVVVLREETITVPAGTFECYVIRCCVRKTRIFSRNSGDIDLWITKDDRRIIVQMTKKEKALFWLTAVFKLISLE